MEKAVVSEPTFRKVAGVVLTTKGTAAVVAVRGVRETTVNAPRLSEVVADRLTDATAHFQHIAGSKRTKKEEKKDMPVGEVNLLVGVVLFAVVMLLVTNVVVPPLAFPKGSHPYYPSR